MIKNKSEMTKEKNLKFNLDIYALRMPNPRIWGIVAFAVGAIVVLCCSFADYYLIVGLCLGIGLMLFALMLLLLPLFLKHNANKVFAENAKGMEKMIFNFVFDNDTVVITNGENVVLAEGGFDNLSEIIETETAFYIMTEPYFGFVVDKDGFEEGDAEQLKQLLQSKEIKYTKIKPASKN